MSLWLWTWYSCCWGLIRAAGEAVLLHDLREEGLRGDNVIEGRRFPKLCIPRGGRGERSESEVVQAEVGLKEIGQDWPKTHIGDEMV